MKYNLGLYNQGLTATFTRQTPAVEIMYHSSILEKDRIAKQQAAMLKSKGIRQVTRLE